MFDGVRRGAILAGLALGVAGCSDRDSSADYVPAPVTPAPARVREGTPNALPIETPKPTEPVKPKVAENPKPAPTDPDSVALVEYGRRLAAVLREKTTAGQTLQDEVQKAGSELDSKGIAALLPPYEKYDRSIKHAVRRIRRLNPPASVKGIHEAILTSCVRLEENLEATVAAMHSDGGDTAAELNHDRRQIVLSGTQAVQKAFEDSGFDAAQFALHGIFVRKG